ncbi:Predicted integral membrane protein [Lactococcus cremoris subsp. cremoris SK11]|uniref:Predicted integral membrane protein n=2 Tax=Lactococcus lactis subsp. cremoris TaxID=1359 RepID=Q02Y83_LACLS|nr:DUF624 domain-containing protein [Lactococcus cremoris]ABJ73089.1 Predicted integral membrane protein [Lactococcus cremoris subsp. cremoris SK11]ARE23694.1 DUF624 domain-containing protein [Lactococcus cremoris]KZK44868.1 Integral membrane protein [Lactococcus cremoris]KZK51546.1 Integral membrane protein [Lactococcus cremoris]MCT4408833.1 DUF624 domain-containing protein [Lactococcus cremoris]
MIGKALEEFFIRIWVVVKLTLIFWLLALSGLLVLGIGPAFKVVTELYLEHGFEYKLISVKQAYQVFKRDFLRADLIFWFYTALSLLLAYNLYLSVQIQGLMFIVIDFILFFGITYLMTAFEYSMIFDSQFDISFGNLLKMSFISNFISFKTYLKLLFGILVICVLTWRFKGLILFGLIGLLQVYSLSVTKDWRLKIEEQLAE